MSLVQELLDELEGILDNGGSIDDLIEEVKEDENDKELLKNAAEKALLIQSKYTKIMVALNTVKLDT